MRCHGCKKPLNGSHLQAMGQNWHAGCFRCAGCDELIQGRFIPKDKKPWHPHCYQKTFVPHCDVCEKPLSGQYLQDYWGHRYCASHKNYARCTSCGRLVCGPITNGGMRFPDGLTICNLCTSNSVITNSRAEQLAEEMRQVLKHFGLNLFQANTPVILADRDELHGNSRHNQHDNHPLLGLATWSTTSVGNRIVSRSFKHILIQKNLPEEHFRTVAIHELGHAWFFYNHYINSKEPGQLPLQLEEGICVLLEYLWLKRLKTKDAEYRRTLIEKSPDPIYGDGFRAAYKALDYLSLSSLISFVIEKRRFPTALSAFFYAG